MAHTHRPRQRRALPAHDPVKFIDVRDLAQWTIRLAEARTFGMFNVIGPESVLRVADLLANIAQETNKPARFVHASREFLAAHVVSHWSDLPVWIDGEGDTAGFHRRRNARAIAAGLTFTPLSKTIADTLAWWNAQPPERTAQLRSGLHVERELQLLEQLDARAS